jgi:hypothetical protein
VFPVTALSKVLMVLYHFNIGIVGLNPAPGMDVRGCIQKFPNWPPERERKWYSSLPLGAVVSVFCESL